MNQLKQFLKSTLLLLTAVALCAAVPAQAAQAEPAAPVLTTAQREMAQQLNGTWKGSFYRDLDAEHYTYDKATLQFINDAKGTPRVYFALESFPGNYLTLENYSMDGEKLSFTFFYGMEKTDVTLTLKNSTVLEAELAQGTSNNAAELKKTSQRPIDIGLKPQYEFENIAGEKWLEKLKAYSTYQSGGTAIPFTYELGNRTNLKNTIDTYHLDELMAEQTTEIGKMTAMMNFVCDHFRHNGESGMPEQQDAATLMQYSKAKGGIECRGLSIILSELLRAYHIPAKSIKCAPYMVNGAYCHVVVHAYSKELKQWVLLDPTYRLMLQDEQGNYVNLPVLRSSLASGAKLIPSTNAGRNQQPFYLEYYRAYMTKNCFHFSSTLELKTGSEGAKNKTIYTLAPANYPATYASYRGEHAAASADAFWAAPVSEK